MKNIWHFHVSKFYGDYGNRATLPFYAYIIYFYCAIILWSSASKNIWGTRNDHYRIHDNIEIHKKLYYKFFIIL